MFLKCPICSNGIEAWSGFRDKCSVSATLCRRSTCTTVYARGWPCHSLVGGHSAAEVTLFCNNRKCRPWRLPSFLFRSSFRKLQKVLLESDGNRANRKFGSDAKAGQFARLRTNLTGCAAVHSIVCRQIDRSYPLLIPRII